MKEQYVKRPVIYYYLDQEGNRRPIDLKINNGYDFWIDQRTVNSIQVRYPLTNGNLYVLIEGFEFRLA